MVCSNKSISLLFSSRLLHLSRSEWHNFPFGRRVYFAGHLSGDEELYETRWRQGIMAIKAVERDEIGKKRKCADPLISILKNNGIKTDLFSSLRSLEPRKCWPIIAKFSSFENWDISMTQSNWNLHFFLVLSLSFIKRNCAPSCCILEFGVACMFIILICMCFPKTALEVALRVLKKCQTINQPTDRSRRKHRWI